MLCFCTKRWFSSPPCIREVVRAVLRKKPIILLLEPDTSEQHGGLTEDECRKILCGEKRLIGPDMRERTYSDRLDDLRQQVSQWSDAWAQPVLLPTAEEIEGALFASAPLIWSSLTDFQDVTLRMIAERLLKGFKHAYGSTYQQETYMQREIELRMQHKEFRSRDASQRKSRSLRSLVSFSWRPSDAQQSSRRRSNVTSNATFPLYVSNHCPRARVVAKEVNELLAASKHPLLKWPEGADNANQLTSCKHMLVHLDSTTWSRGKESESFALEVCDAMKKGMHLLLAHEVPGARRDDTSRCGCSFEQIIESTPEYLLNAGIYRHDIAIPLAGNEWRVAGLVSLGREILKKGRLTQYDIDALQEGEQLAAMTTTSLGENHRKITSDNEPRPSIRRSSSREEALASRRTSASATSRPDRVLRACARIPSQAASVIQAGIETARSSVGHADIIPGVQTIKRAVSQSRPTTHSLEAEQAADVEMPVSGAQRSPSLGSTVSDSSLPQASCLPMPKLASTPPSATLPTSGALPGQQPLERGQSSARKLTSQTASKPETIHVSSSMSPNANTVLGVQTLKRAGSGSRPAADSLDAPALADVEMPLSGAQRRASLRPTVSDSSLPQAPCPTTPELASRRPSATQSASGTLPGQQPLERWQSSARKLTSQTASKVETICRL